MTLSKVRAYIESKIKDVDSKFKRVESPFNIDVAENIADKSYFIKYDVTSSEQMQTSIKDSIYVECQFSFKSFRHGIDKYDYAMDLVNTIRMKCINIKELVEFDDTDQNKIISCETISQNGEQLPNNNKIIIINLTLELNINQAIC